MYKKIFKRNELKFVLTKRQKEILLNDFKDYIKIDQYGLTKICNIYFDTNTYLLIRKSIEKPLYKEKIRIRSYGEINIDDDVFVEVKKKYDHVVYKRRLALKEEEAINWLLKKEKCTKEGQIVNEIDYFIHFYENLEPKLFLSYDREAYISDELNEFRITFDENICARVDNFTFKNNSGGINILDEDKVLMEIKCLGGLPLWLTKVLSREKIYKTSFSKYGEAYKKLIFKNKEI